MTTTPGSIPELEPLAAPQTNEERRERQRLHVKRTYYKKLSQMQSLRGNLQQLEQEFERLLAHQRAVDSANSQQIQSQLLQNAAFLKEDYKQEVSTLGSSSTSNSQEGHETMQAMLTEILAVKERLRSENDALQRAIGQQERFAIKISSWMDIEDLGTSSSDDDIYVRAQDPSTIRLAALIAVETCQEIARQTYAEMQHFSQNPDFVSTGVSVFGWRDKRVRVEDRIKFSMQKTFEGVTAFELSVRGWSVIGSSNRLAQLYSASMNVKVTTLQRVDDDNEVKLRVMSSHDGKKLVRTLFLTSRFAISDGYVSIIRSLDPHKHLAPYADPLGVEEQWVESYNWTRFQEAGDGAQHCRLIFGGEVQSNAVAGSDTWMIEILLVALRWENLVVRPIFAIAC